MFLHMDITRTTTGTTAIRAGMWRRGTSDPPDCDQSQRPVAAPEYFGCDQDRCAEPSWSPGAVAVRPKTRAEVSETAGAVPSGRREEEEEIMISSLVRSAIQHLDTIDSTDYYPLHEYDRDTLHRLATTDPWTDDDARSAMFLFAKYRRILIRDGFDYHAVFPKNRHNHDEEERTKKVYEHLDYLVKRHNVKPPFCFDLRSLDEMEQWVKNKIIEVRILNAKRNGTAAATAR